MLIRPPVLIQNLYHPCLWTDFTRSPALLESYWSEKAADESVNRRTFYQILFCDNID